MTFPSEMSSQMPSHPVTCSCGGLPVPHRTAETAGPGYYLPGWVLKCQRCGHRAESGLTIDDACFAWERDQAAIGQAITPLTDQEVRDLLSQTLHGPLPNSTIQRAFATLVQLAKERDELIRRVQYEKERRADAERQMGYGDEQWYED